MSRKVLFGILCLFVVRLDAQRAEPEFVRDAIGMTARAAAPHIADREGLAPLVTLAPATQIVPEEIDAIHAWNRQGRVPAKNGFTRSIGEPVFVRVAAAGSLTTNAVAAGGVITESTRGTLIWSGSVRVESAHRVRLHLDNVHVPPGTTFWSYGRTGTPKAFGTELIDPNGDLYAPSTEGEMAYLEVELPADAAEASFEIRDVLELVPLREGLLQDKFPGTQDTPSCLIDATCVTSASLDVIDQLRKAIAHLQYVKSGGSFVCSGGLVNDTDSSSFIPYLLTANHCFDSQSSATSLEAFWDYLTATCAGTFPNLNTVVSTNGSTLLATNAGSDFTFLRLNSVPSGRFFLGWDSRTSVVPHGTKLFRISHPFPDAFVQPAPQAYSTTFVSTTVGTCSSRPRGPYLYSTASDGGVYGGSSGSPVIIAGGYIVGQLYGACGPNDPSAGCDNSNSTVDGSFSTTYASVASFLNPTVQPNCTANATTACMLNGRFRVTVRFRNGFDNGNVDTSAKVKSVTGFSNPNYETAFFFFNSENNIELLVKILDQGNKNSQGQPTIAVLFGSATPLRIELTLVDTVKNATKVYSSAFNQMRGNTDFTAFVK